MELSVAKPSFDDFLMSMGLAQFQNSKLAGLGSQVHSCGLLFPLRSGEHEISSISWFRGFSQLLMELSVAKPSFHDFLTSMGFAQFQNTKLAGLGSQVHSHVASFSPCSVGNTRFHRFHGFVDSAVADGTVSGQAQLPRFFDVEQVLQNSTTQDLLVWGRKCTRVASFSPCAVGNTRFHRIRGFVDSAVADGTVSGQALLP